MHTFIKDQTLFTRRMILNIRINDHPLVEEILRHTGYFKVVGALKQEAIQMVGYRIWLESKEYDYFNECMEDVKFEVVHDIAVMEYRFQVIASIPEDIYAHYTFVEK
jgi:hypothetical protein